MAGDELSVQETIAGRYRGMIHSGRLKSGERLPTVREIAHDLLVSITPVRAAYKILENEGLIYQRRGAGTFVGRSAIQAPASLEIGVLFRETRGWTEDDNYGLRLFRGIQDALHAGGHRTVLATLPSDASAYGSAARKLLAGYPHGFVLDERVPDDIIERLAASGRPVVIVNGRTTTPGVGVAQADARQAGETTARKILEKGHRVAACLWRSDWNGDHAAEAFLGVMAGNAAAVAPQHVAVADMQKERKEDLYAAFKRVISYPPVPTAVFCTDDRIARAFCRWAQESGLRAPEDISIVGVMDLAMAARNEPPLATFRFEPERIGGAAVEEVVACCRDSGRSPRSVKIPGTWVERDSLAAPAVLPKAASAERR